MDRTLDYRSNYIIKVTASIWRMPVFKGSDNKK